MGGVAARLNDATVRFRSQVQLVDSRRCSISAAARSSSCCCIALIVLGPEKLPEAVRKFGKVYAELKKMSTGFQSELKSALDEPMREMRETAEAFKKAANFDFDDEPDEPGVSDDVKADRAPAEPAPTRPSSTTGASPSPCSRSSPVDADQRPPDERPRDDEPCRLSAPAGPDLSLRSAAAAEGRRSCRGARFRMKLSP